MEKLYTMWGVLLLLFVVVLIVKNVKEGRAIQRNESANNPMFQRGWTQARDRSSSKYHTAGP